MTHPYWPCCGQSTTMWSTDGGDEKGAEIPPQMHSGDVRVLVFLMCLGVSGFWGCLEFDFGGVWEYLGIGGYLGCLVVSGCIWVLGVSGVYEYIWLSGIWGCLGASGCLGISGVSVSGVSACWGSLEMSGCLECLGVSEVRGLGECH